MKQIGVRLITDGVFMAPNGLLWGLVVGMLLLSGGGTAQAEAASSSTVAAVYGAQCASCHGTTLGGGGAPALKGPAFKTKWTEAKALADFIRRSMPPGAATPLDPVIAQQLAGYILAQNNASAGAAAPAGPPKIEDAIAREAAARLKAVANRLTPVTDAMLQSPPKEDWLVWRGSVGALGFSALDQINRSNIGSLRLVWSKTLGPGGNGIGPLAHDGVIFVHGGSAIAAIDAVSGDTIWKVEDTTPPRGSTQPRGVALYGTTLYVSTVDDHVKALDARTGRLIWDRVIADQPTVTAPPLVANGRVFQGTAVCFARSVRCFMAALDAKTGKELWRFHTVPGDDEPGSDSWNGAPASERSGAGVWAGTSYDYARNQIIFGTGNTYAVNTLLKKDPKKPAAALYTNTTLKLDAETGKLVWHFQHVAGDVWDEDWAYERMIIDDPRDSGHQAVVTMGKLGILDALDPETGRYKWSVDMGLQDIVTSIDPKTGAKTLDANKIPAEGKSISACPFAGGVRNWPATSYDPGSRLMFIPILEACMEVKIDKSQIEQSVWKVKPRPGSDGKFGSVAAIDLRTGKTVWNVRRRAPEAAAVLATAGGLVFEGSRDRWFRALDSSTGKTLWQMRLSDTPNSFPITFSAGGTQYIAVVTGGGTYLDGLVSHLTPEIEPSLGRPALWVFALEKQELK